MSLKQNIKKILKEETKMNIRLRRRLEMLDYEVESRLTKDSWYAPRICDYNNGEELFEDIMESSIDSMYWNYFYSEDDSGEWTEIYDDMVKYITEKYGDKIKEYYYINCGKETLRINESKIPVSERRRLPIFIEKAFEKNLKRINRKKSTKKEDYFKKVIEYTLCDLHGDYFVYNKLSDEEWEEYKKYIISYIESNYKI